MSNFIHVRTKTGDDSTQPEDHDDDRLDRLGSHHGRHGRTEPHSQMAVPVVSWVPGQDRTKRIHTALDRRPLTGEGGRRQAGRRQEGEKKKQGWARNPCLHTRIEDDTLPALPCPGGGCLPSDPTSFPRGARGTMFLAQPYGALTDSRFCTSMEIMG